MTTLQFGLWRTGLGAAERAGTVDPNKVADGRRCPSAERRAGVYLLIHVAYPRRCLDGDPVDGPVEGAGAGESGPPAELPNPHRLVSGERVPGPVHGGGDLRREGQPHTDAKSDVDVDAAQVVRCVPDNEEDRVDGCAARSFALEQLGDFGA